MQNRNSLECKSNLDSMDRLRLAQRQSLPEVAFQSFLLRKMSDLLLTGWLRYLVRIPLNC